MSNETDYPTSVLAVANWFIKKAHDTNKPITHMKLQKLVYIAYGWYYACYEIPLFSEDIVAWTHGPVVPSLYFVFKDCGKNPIDHFAEKYTDLNNDGKFRRKRVFYLCFQFGNDIHAS